MSLSNSVFGFGSIQAVNRARMSGFGFVIFQKRTFTIIVGSLPPSAATLHRQRPIGVKWLGGRYLRRGTPNSVYAQGGYYSSTNYKQYKELIGYTVIIYYHHIIHWSRTAQNNYFKGMKASLRIEILGLKMPRNCNFKPSTGCIFAINKSQCSFPHTCI